MKKYIITQPVIWVALLVSMSCNDLVTIDVPQNQLTTTVVFSDSASVKSALLNIYSLLEKRQYPAANKYLATYADESLSLNGEHWNQSAINSSETTNRAHWTYLYSTIYQANAILEHLTESSTIPGTFVKQVGGEALFLRAYAYFYLVNCWGRVPLILTTDVNSNRSALQSEPEVVYEQVVIDLQEARERLGTAYAGSGKVRANRAAATALLARVYLYRGEWALAEEMATELIDSGQYTPLGPLEVVFTENSRGSILQLATEYGYTTEASQVIPQSATARPSYYFTDAFYESFEPDDLRKLMWISTNEVYIEEGKMVYHYPHKYKKNAPDASEWENLVVLRIAEQYLIRAEARAHQDKLAGKDAALVDLNTVRQRAGLLPIEATNKVEVLQAIVDERRHELFFENADRLFDMRRRGVLDEVMADAKPTWVPSAVWLPIPLADTRTNPNLNQNNGYEQ